MLTDGNMKRLPCSYVSKYNAVFWQLFYIACYSQLILIKMITIHWDFTDGSEVSYMQGKLLGDNFTTHCLDFFNMDEQVDDVVVLRSDGAKISRKNIKEHSFKEIRKSHNIHKMLVAGSFNWL